MKKTILIVGLVVAALVVLGVGVAFAQGPTPYAGGGMMGGNGGGWMHNYVEQALAAKLGLTEAQVEDQLAAGKPMYQIALDNGIKQDDLTTFLGEVHTEAFAKAVKDGVVTQQQADLMLSRMQSRGFGTGNCSMQNGTGTGYGPGGMMGRGNGMMGRGFGWQNQQTNP
ncbi:MAG: hypothetical protein ABI904_15860 [Chloroflexota bacterium]